MLGCEGQVGEGPCLLCQDSWRPPFLLHPGAPPATEGHSGGPSAFAGCVGPVAPRMASVLAQDPLPTLCSDFYVPSPGLGPPLG